MQQIITLNVGGIKYTTTKSMISRAPESSLFTMTPSPQTGEIFIDRNGNLFQYVLDYLRDGNSIALPLDIQVCRALINESRFFNMSAFTQKISAHIELLLNEGKIIKYDEVYRRNDSSFEDACNDRIKDGWSPHGGISVHDTNTSYTIRVQAFVQYQNNFGCHFK